jgi:hypothetical protein
MEGIFFHIRVQIYIPLQFQRVRTDLLESNFSLTEFFLKPCRMLLLLSCRKVKYLLAACLPSIVYQIFCNQRLAIDS